MFDSISTRNIYLLLGSTLLLIGFMSDDEESKGYIFSLVFILIILFICFHSLFFSKDITDSEFGRSIVGKKFITQDYTSLNFSGYDKKYYLTLWNNKPSPVNPKSGSFYLKVKPGLIFVVKDSILKYDFENGYRIKIKIEFVNQPKLADEINPSRNLDINFIENSDRTDPIGFVSLDENNEWLNAYNDSHLRLIERVDDITDKNRKLNTTKIDSEIILSLNRDFFETENGEDILMILGNKLEKMRVVPKKNIIDYYSK